MILGAPLMLLGLVVLPVLWWLLRALPPAPRVQAFPAIRLLEGLHGPLRESRRAPPWLLALRIAAALLLVLGLAQPVLVQDRQAAAGTGTLLLAVDNGWAAAPGWPNRLQAAHETLDWAARAGRAVRLLLTAPDADGAPPHPGPELQPGLLRDRLDQARPMPWPVDRAAAARALGRTAGLGIGSVVYLSDGLADHPDTSADRDFAAALQRLGPVVELRSGPHAISLLAAPMSAPGRLLARLVTLPQPIARQLVLRGETEQGGTLVRLAIDIPAGASRAEAPITLPAELRNQLSRLVLDGVPGPAGIRLLDEGDRRRPVGLLSSGGGDTPLLGTLFYLRRALAPTADLREGNLAQLLSHQLSVLIAPDGSLEDAADRERVGAWVKQGGTLIRFAGPRLAARQAAPPTPASDTRTTDADLEQPAGDPAPAEGVPEPLLPVTLLGGARQLGGTMSWGKPEHPAPFAADSPFAGLAVPDEVTVSRQVLAQPTADLDGRSWARLADGTPLVTHAALGDGQLVLFHVTSNADWSNLALSGLFPQMLQRLVQRAAGLSTPADRTVLAPVATLGADGVLGPPPPAAQGLAADAFARTPVSAQHPAGLYGPISTRRSLNLADGLPPLAVEPVAGELRNLADRIPDRPFGQILLAVALGLLMLDLLATMALRGLLPGARSRRRATAGVIGAVVLLALGGSLPTEPAHAVEPAATPKAALETRLAYVITGDPAVDEVSRQGLEGLSAYANARTSARLGTPDGVVPGRDDLAFYPLLYWPVTPATIATAAPGAGWTSALNFYMSHGGILLIDTQGSDTPSGGQGGADGATDNSAFTFFSPGTTRALRQATAGLDIPALRQVDSQHVLSHSFYLLHGFPGRTVGAPVWVARDDDLGNDGVSPVIIGANDWAAAWAVDAGGLTPHAVIPGGESQRVTAYRFGVNAVMYALTGNYKTDQVHVPALLERLGQ